MTITNPYYEFDPTFTPGTKARSDAVNLQYQAIQNAFDFLPSSNDALTTGTSTFAPESGAADAYVVTMPDTRLSEQDGDEIVFFATNANTGASTLEVDGLGPKAIVDWEGLALDSGNIIAGICYIVRYDATNTRYQLTSPKGNYGASAAADAAAAAASASDAADSATEAMQWAVNPEDDDVDSAPGEFSSFHWAQKALAAASTNRINTDLATANPPTTEAVTGNYEIYDATDAVELATLGFNASNDITLYNRFHGGDINMIREDASGIQKLIFRAQEAGETYIAGESTIAMRFHAGNEYAVLGTLNAGVDIRYDNVDVARTVAAASGGLEANNTLTGAGFERVLTTSDAAGAVTQLEDGSGNIAVIGEGSGIIGVRSVGNTDAEDRRLTWEYQDGTIRSSIGQEFFTDVIYRNHIAGRHQIFYCGTGGSSRIRLHLDGTSATGGVTLYAGTSAVGRLATADEGVRIQNGNLFLAEQAAQELDDAGFGQLWVDSSDDSLHYITEAGVDTDLTAFTGLVNVTDDVLGANVSVAGTDTSLFLQHAGVDAARIRSVNTGGLELTSLVHGARILLAGEDLAGTLRTIIDADPDGISSFRADTDLELLVGASNSGLIARSGGEVELYYNNAIQLETTSIGLSMEAGKTIDFSASMEIREGRIDLNGLATGLQITGQDENDDGLVLEDGARVTWEDLAFANHVYLRNEGIGGGSGTLTMRADSTASFILAGTGLQWNNSGLTTPISANILTTPTRLNISDAVNIQGELYLTDRQNAGTDIAAQGQVWVQNDAPNHLMYTDDTGDDFTVGIAGGHSGANVVVNGSHNFNTTDNRAGNFIYIGFDGGADTITLGNSTGTGLTNWPLYTSIQLIVPGSNTVTVTEGTGTTLYDETGTDTVGGVTVSQGVVTIFRQDATTYIIWGSGWT